MICPIEEIVKSVREDTGIVIAKLNRMLEIYLLKNHELYSVSRTKEIKRSFESVEYKLFLVAIHLEQVWALSEDARSDLTKAIENSLDCLRWDDDQLIIGSMFLESFIFEARSFLDIFMRHICLIMNVENPEWISIQNFYKNLKSCKNPSLEVRAEKLQTYFQRRVFNHDTWGSMMNKLRNTIAHRERLRPLREGSETLLNQVLLDWPTLNGKTFDRFCQDIHNDIFGILQDTAPLLYDLKWKSGPYRPDLWKKNGSA